MDTLIDSEEDVNLLADAGVIENNLGASEDASKLFNNLCKEVVLGKFFFFNQWKHVDDYYNHPWRRSLALLRPSVLPRSHRSSAMLCLVQAYDVMWTMTVAFVSFVILASVMNPVITQKELGEDDPKEDHQIMRQPMRNQLSSSQLVNQFELHSESRLRRRVSRHSQTTELNHLKKEKVKEGEQWKVNNAKVISWILGSVVTSIGILMRGLHSVEDMWEYLEKVYQQSNFALKFQVEHDIFIYGQGEKSIQYYYAGFMNLWIEYEFVTMRKITSACCLRALKDINDERKVMQFLMKLRPNYEIVWANIVNHGTLPSMYVVLGKLLREETRIPT
ncbi:hypothetical protein RJ639_016934 [Escallonia herrerae]|uniref:Uncharacterized protein n=1 Tax=Escallonia herrerae TaxID=1293975 RepID=A0AA89ALK3_9ASTE|nr:hypothetical protein RJ639_016934 [Escallonia herrerae]